MKKTLLIISVALLALTSCQKEAEQTFQYNVDRFYDVEVLRYQVPGFDQLTLKQKQLVWYLSEAALQGRDIFYDQNGAYNLRIRRTLEELYVNYKGDRSQNDFQKFERYLKRVWFSNGIYHHRSGDKFRPEFPREWFVRALAETSIQYDEAILPIMFDPMVAPKRKARDGRDIVLHSYGNYYSPDVTYKEAHDWYLAHRDTSATPLPVGLNTKLCKDENGKLYERTYCIGSLYSPAIEKIVYWLEKAQTVAENEQQEKALELLIDFYRSGNLATFNDYNIAWVNDLNSRVDHINGFIEATDDPLGLTGAWEGLVHFRDMEASKRMEVIAANAQWFEDNLPVDPRFRNPHVRAASATVVTAAMLGGQLYPASYNAITLPNADWIRANYGTKAVTLDNILNAKGEARRGNGFNHEFMFDQVIYDHYSRYASVCSNVDWDLRECLGNTGGQRLPGVDEDALHEYEQLLLLVRGRLFSLYFMADPKLVELGLLPDAEAYKALYYQVFMEGLLTQLGTIRPGKEIEEQTDQVLHLIASWVYENRQAKELEVINRSGKWYLRITDYEGLRTLIGELLHEVQRIISEGDYDAAAHLVANYAVKVKYAQWHENIYQRYEMLDFTPHQGFVNPVYKPKYDENGNLIDVVVELTESFVEQNLRYSSDYSNLPDIND